jgi:hypothetical protein
VSLSAVVDVAVLVGLVTAGSVYLHGRVNTVDAAVGPVLTDSTLGALDLVSDIKSSVNFHDLEGARGTLVFVFLSTC